jgi:predicted HicB family RNase H-like nuclease
MQNRDISYYLSLPYTMIIKNMNDETGTYLYGTFLELDGCQSTAKTHQELIENLEEVKTMWLESRLEHNEKIPEPQSLEFSGRINLRIPKSLHRKLSLAADLEDISLNQYMLYKLSQ